jgi:hypothetical protein
MTKAVRPIPAAVHRVHPRSTFTQAEDAALVDLVRELGDADWDEVAVRLRGRNPRQCRDRWLSYLSPDIGNGPWTTEEEMLLLEEQAKYGTAWKRIAQSFPGRTDINVKSRFLLIQRRLRKKASLRLFVAPVLTPSIATRPLPFHIPVPRPPPKPILVTPPVEPDQPPPGFDDADNDLDVWNGLMMNCEPGLGFPLDGWF